jgi:predicted permease
MESLRYDLAHATRAVRRRPLLAIVAALSIAIGIGATTSILSIANTLLRQPLPGIAEPERIVEVGRTDRGDGFDTFSYVDFLDLRQATGTFSHLAAFTFQSASVSAGGEGRRLMGMTVSADYFPVLGVRPVLGRVLLPDEDLVPGANPVVVISHRLWTDMFGADPAVTGRNIVLSRIPFEVVGVAPPAFQGHIIAVQPDFWVPVTMAPTIARQGAGSFRSRGSMNFLLIGRLATGVSVEEADVATQTVMARLAAEHPETNATRGARVTMAGPVPAIGRTPVALFTVALMGMVGLILLTICSNVGGMLLARAASRERETAVRVALGAPRARLVRQLLFEALMIFAAGGLGGLLVAHWGMAALVAIRLPVPVEIALDFSPDLGVLLTGFVLALGTGLVFGLVPALQASNPGIAGILKDSGNAGGARTGRARRAFVAVQVAASITLLAAAGLFLRALQHAGTIPMGFDPDAVHTTTVNLALEGYGPADGAAYFTRLLDRLQAVPGVTAAAIARDLPLDLGSSGESVVPDDYASRADSTVAVDFNVVSPDYFRTLSIAVLVGRAFSASDTPDGQPVMIVDRTFADRMWPGGEALGRRVRISGDSSWRMIVGLVDRVPNQRVNEVARPMVYLPHAQDYAGAAQVIVRGPGVPGMGPAIRAAILELDPAVSITPVIPLADYTAIAILPQRAAALLTASLGILALFLCALGLYGIVAHDVARRTREIGVRVAVGAQGTDVARLVVVGAMRLAVPGVVAGGLLALGLAQVLQAFLLGLSPFDPAALTAAVGVLLLTILAAVVVPARRAMIVQPIDALRAE